MLCCLVNDFSFAQNSLQFGCGFNIGYKSTFQEGGMFATLKLSDKVLTNVGFNKGRYLGYGLGSEVIIPLLRKEFYPFIGCAFSYNFGTDFDLGNSNELTFYRVESNFFIIPEVGVTKKIKTSPDENNPLLDIESCLISVHINYSSASNKTRLVYLSGDIPNSQEGIINDRISNGIGVSISFIVIFSKNN